MFLALVSFSGPQEIRAAASRANPVAQAGAPPGARGVGLPPMVSVDTAASTRARSAPVRGRPRGRVLLTERLALDCRSCSQASTSRGFLPGNVHVSRKDCSQRWRDSRLRVMKANMLYHPADSHHSERSAPSSRRARGVRAYVVPAVATDGSLTTCGPPGPTRRHERSTHARGDMRIDIDQRFYNF